MPSNIRIETLSGAGPMPARSCMPLQIGRRGADQERGVACPRVNPAGIASGMGCAGRQGERARSKEEPGLQRAGLPSH